MNSITSQQSLDRIADVLGHIRGKGVKLWSKNGRLHYEAPKGALTQEEIDGLRVSKDEIVAFLERFDATTSKPAYGLPSQSERAPLAFSQLAHWNLYRLSERRSLRQIASATRLCGKLSLDAFRDSVLEIVRRHGALRTQISIVDGVPLQEVHHSCDVELEVGDLTALAASVREAEVLRAIEHFILDPIDVSMRPLFGIRLLRLRDDEHVLIVAMEHMISDMFSLNILLRELLTAYTQKFQGYAFALPAIPVQFVDYAVAQRSREKSWLAKHGGYWKEHLIDCQPLRFPEGARLSSESSEGWGTVPLQIGRVLKAELGEWCRTRRTTIVMSVFTAYVALVLRWCNVSEGVIRFLTDGRLGHGLGNTIGYFASSLYLRLALSEDDGFANLLHRVTKEYCESHENADFSFLSSQVPRPEFTRSTCFNWIPKSAASDLSGSGADGCVLTCSPVPFAHPMIRTLEWDAEPVVVFYDTCDEVVGGVHFPLNRFSAGTMARFGRNLLMFIEVLLRKPEERVKDIVLL